MGSLEGIPRVPVTRLLGQIFATGARRYEMREMQAKVHREFGPVAVMGGGRFANVFLFGPEAQVRLVAHQLVLRYRWSVPAGYQMPVQQAPISKPVDGLPIDLEPIG
jgi:hypothetical protein